MLRKQVSRHVPSKRVRSSRRLNLESLEPRQLLSASTFTPDYFKILATSTNKAQASSTNSGYTPAQIRTAYGFSSTSFGSTAATGAGETIAIIDAYNDPNIAADLATFDAAYGIAAPPSLSVVNQSGGTSLPGTDSSAGWEVEESLDVEWAHAIAPGANIILVEANNSSDSNLFAAVNYARNLKRGIGDLDELGSDDSSADTSNDQALSSEYLVTPAGHQGITFVASSGDEGVANFPAESPNVLAVGGTDVYLNSNNTISSETAWTPQKSGSVTYSGGGGVSVEFPGRDVPDVSYDAGVGYAIYDSFDGTGGWIGVGGTSAGAPQWAALIAIANQGRALSGLGTLNGASQTIAAMYAAPAADFHDITTGSTQFESAGVGYDLATGIGTPVANNLIPYLVSYGGSGSTGGGTASAPAAPASISATATSSSQIDLTWSASSGAAGYTVLELQSNGSYTSIGSTSSNATSANPFVVNGLTANTKYSFEVEAYGSPTTNVSAPATASTTTQAAAVTLAAPTASVSATSSTVAQVSWSTSAGATGYLVFEKSGTATSYVQVANLAAGNTSVNISGQTAGATESFYVEAYIETNGVITTTASSKAVSLVMPTATAVAAPTNVTAAATSSSTGTLSWTGSSGATSYAIYYWNGRQAVYLGSVSSTTTSVTISGLPAGATTDLAVVAVNSTSSAASAWVGLTTPAVTPSRTAADYLFGEYAQSQQSRQFP